MSYGKVKNCVTVSINVLKPFKQSAENMYCICFVVVIFLALDLSLDLPVWWIYVPAKWISPAILPLELLQLIVLSTNTI